MNDHTAIRYCLGGYRRCSEELATRYLQLLDQLVEKRTQPVLIESWVRPTESDTAERIETVLTSWHGPKERNVSGLSDQLHFITSTDFPPSFALAATAPGYNSFLANCITFWSENSVAKVPTEVNLNLSIQGPIQEAVDHFRQSLESTGRWNHVMIQGFTNGLLSLVYAPFLLLMTEEESLAQFLVNILELWVSGWVILSCYYGTWYVLVETLPIPDRYSIGDTVWPMSGHSSFF